MLVIRQFRYDLTNDSLAVGYSLCSEYEETLSETKKPRSGFRRGFGLVQLWLGGGGFRHGNADGKHDWFYPFISTATKTYFYYELGIACCREMWLR